MKVELFSRQSNITGEGPLWSETEQALYWIDIGGKKLHRANLNADVKVWPLPDYPGCLAELGEGRIAVAMGAGPSAFDTRTGDIKSLGAAPPMRAGTRFNDGKVDPQGRLWAGTMRNNFGPKGEPQPIDRDDGMLFRFDRGGPVVVEDKLWCSNTLAWSPDGRRFYFADSIPNKIFTYDYDATSGAISNRSLLFEEAGHGLPDGSTIDVDGCLWNARWDASELLRITPDGRIDRRVPMPVQRPTSCIFGGPNLDILFVTSATNGLSEDARAKAPLSGSVFAITGLGQGLATPLWQRSA